MGLIIAAATLSLCEECKAHGFLVFSDGSKSEEILYQEQAREQVEQALFTKKITSFEVEYLLVLLAKSNIPLKAEFGVTTNDTQEFPVKDVKKGGVPTQSH